MQKKRPNQVKSNVDKGLIKSMELRSIGSGLTTVVKIRAYKKNATKKIWELFLSSQPQEHLSTIQWQKEEYQC